MSDLIRRDDVVNLLAEHFTGLKDDLIIPLSFFPSPIDYFRGLINQIPTAEPKEYVKDGTLTVQMPTIKEAKAVDKIVVYADTYKQEYHKPREWEWCDTCKEYDQQRHCCKRFIYVISHSVARLEEEYKPKVGAWIDDEEYNTKYGYYFAHCSECGYQMDVHENRGYHSYCPHCGAKIERSER